ncbi:MAG: hypothetical protein ACRBCS_07620 [Cellvibrionaceae bacterium]
MKQKASLIILSIDLLAFAFKFERSQKKAAMIPAEGLKVEVDFEQIAENIGAFLDVRG